VQEAGFSPNKFQTAYDQDMLLEKHIGLIRELGHFHVSGEVRRKSKQEPTFPSHTVFDHPGDESENWQSSFQRKQIPSMLSRPMTRQASKRTGIDGSRLSVATGNGLN
jgi:hypothetical protein